MKRILSFLALASCAFAGTWMASPGKGSHAAAGVTAPTFIQEAEVTNWDQLTSPQTTGSFSVQVGDVLVAFVMVENDIDNTSTPTNTGTAFTWTPQQQIDVTDYVQVRIYTAIATAAQSMTVSVARAGGNTYRFGMNVLTFRGSAGVGTSNQANAATGLPSVTLTGVAASSAIVMASGDWDSEDGASRTYNTTSAGTFSENTYYRNAAAYAVYGGRYANAGSAGSKTVGITAPSGQKWSLVAVEIRGQ